MIIQHTSWKVTLANIFRTIPDVSGDDVISPNDLEDCMPPEDRRAGANFAIIFDYNGIERKSFRETWQHSS